MKKYFILVSTLVLSVFLFAVEASAGYNANMTGTIKGIYTYAQSDAIYMKLQNQPTSHPGCNPAYFVIDKSVPESRRQMMFSRFLAAFVAKETVNIGYDKEGGCADGYIRVYRAG